MRYYITHRARRTHLASEFVFVSVCCIPNTGAFLLIDHIHSHIHTDTTEREREQKKWLLCVCLDSRSPLFLSGYRCRFVIVKVDHFVSKHKFLNWDFTFSSLVFHGDFSLPFATFLPFLTHTHTRQQNGNLFSFQLALCPHLSLCVSNDLNTSISCEHDGFRSASTFSVFACTLYFDVS